MSASVIQNAIGTLVDRQDLGSDRAAAAMHAIMSGEATPAQIAAFAVALRVKGETASEIAGCATTMRRYAAACTVARKPLVDLCGTGGDGTGTFNISTTAAFVVAGAGVAVAKHGNRSVSSRSGSADLLQALGVNIELETDRVGACIEEVGIGFLFAPTFHPAMRHASGPRRELGIRTVFNILGPLCNPAHADRQLLGVYDPALLDLVAGALLELGCHTALVVHGADGLDELSTCGPNKGILVRGGELRHLPIDPQSLGFGQATLADLVGGDAQDNAQITLRILEGDRGPKRDVVVLNAAAAMLAADAVKDLPAGIAAAENAIDCGAARAKLRHLVAFTNGASA